MKLIFTLAILIISSTLSAAEFDCGRCTTEETKTAERAFKYATQEERYAKLKQLISNADTNNPKEFAKIRALLCSTRQYLTKERILCPQPIWKQMLNRTQWWEGATPVEDNDRCNSLVGAGLTGYIGLADHKDLRNLLQIAIERNAKNVVKLIHSEFHGPSLFRKEFFQTGYSPRSHCIQLPNEFDILASIAHQHKDPVGMAKTLASFRSENEQPFSNELKNRCAQSWQDPKYAQFCGFINEALKRYGAQHDLETFERNLESYASNAK